MTPGRKKLLGIGGAVLLVLFVLGYWRFVIPLRKSVDIGAGMLAKQICSCVYVAQRELDACRADQLPSMDAIQVEVEREARRVRAWIPALGERSAFYADGLGCTLE